MQINIKVFYKFIASFWVCGATHAQSTQNNKSALSLQYLKEKLKGKVNFQPADKYLQRFLQIDTVILSVWLGMRKLPKIRKKGVMKLIFCMQMSIKVSYKLIQYFFDGGQSSIPKVSKIASWQCLKKEARDEVDFLQADKHQSFLKVDFNTLGIRVSYKEMLSLLKGMTKHS